MNLFVLFVKGEVFLVIFFVIIFGIVIIYFMNRNEERVRKLVEIFLRVFDGFVEVMYFIVGGVM